MYSWNCPSPNFSGARNNGCQSCFAGRQSGSLGFHHLSADPVRDRLSAFGRDLDPPDSSRSRARTLSFSTTRGASFCWLAGRNVQRDLVFRVGWFEAGPGNSSGGRDLYRHHFACLEPPNQPGRVHVSEEGHLNVLCGSGELSSSSENHSSFGSNPAQGLHACISKTQARPAAPMK